MRKLWLDDIRKPPDETWDRVKNYEDFVYFIETNGVPDLISFDHDLGGEHYKALLANPKKHLLNEGFEKKTGYDCAKWLVRNNHKIKKFFVHSCNPIGRDNINCLLNNWKNFCENEEYFIDRITKEIGEQ